MKNIEFKVGILVILSVIGVIGFYFYTNNIVSKEGKLFYVDFTFSGAIKSGAAVKISGITIGEVKKVEFMFGKKGDNGKPIVVRVHAFIEKKYLSVIRKGSSFFITTAGLLGETYLGVDTIDFDAPLVSEKEAIWGEEPPKMDLMISQAAKLLNDISIFLDKNSDKLTQIIEKATLLMDGVNNILTENRETIKITLKNSNLLLEEGILIAKKGNEQLSFGGNIKNILINGEKISKTVANRLNPMLDSVNSVLQETDEILKFGNSFFQKNENNLNSLLDTGVQLAKQSLSVLQKADLMVSDIYDGKGNIGLFFKGSDIYTLAKEFLLNLKKSPWKVLWRAE
ncbi:MCE family protein [bacterium]|nr:MCE family protein [bacterium]